MEDMKRKLIFKKMHGIGNDFIVIDSNDNQWLFADGQFNLKPNELAKIANRNRGIGCDQVLVIAPSSNKAANFDYLIYNQDGSSAEYCGNGARCVIRYLADKYKLDSPIILNTNNRLSTGSVFGRGHVTINAGVPNFDPKASGCDKEINKYNDYSYLVGNQIINFGIVSMGNPHAIVKLANSRQLHATATLVKIAEAIQASGLFANGVNVSFFLISTPEKIQMRTYERGAGFTLACGSGACATASFAIANKLCKPKVTVSMPGGSLQISWDLAHEIEMAGDAAYVFDGSMIL
ncbi:MAG: diaminopimelate epimerase [Burkholderiales bacterium]|jgi:diaminopimelate epimerase|nr:diaminopimelate epimerase [Burkholderiales bacterium]